MHLPDSTETTKRLPSTHYLTATSDQLKNGHLKFSNSHINHTMTFTVSRMHLPDTTINTCPSELNNYFDENVARERTAKYHSLPKNNTRKMKCYF